jgi:hypothetical protein
MPLSLEENLAVFDGAVSVEQAEALLAWAQKYPNGRAELSNCAHLHAAVLQVLLAAHIKVERWPTDESLGAWLKAALNS